MSTVKDNKAKSLLDSFYQALIRHSPRISRKKLRKSVEKQASLAAATTTTIKNSYSADQKPRPKSVYQFPDIVVDDYDYPGFSQSRHTKLSTQLIYDDYQSQSAKVLALPWEQEQAHQVDFTPQPACEFKVRSGSLNYGLG